MKKPSSQKDEQPILPALPHKVNPNRYTLDDVNTITEKLFKNSIDLIDYEFGKDYSIKNPHLLRTVIEIQKDLLKFNLV